MLNLIAKKIRSAAILTTSHVAADVITDAHNYNQLIIRAFYTKGSLTSLEIKIEYSDDGTNYTQQTNASVSGGTSTLTVNEYTYTGATANIEIVTPISARFVKVSAKGTGTVTSSSLELWANLSVV